jgi:hypothetical protein
MAFRQSGHPWYSLSRKRGRQTCLLVVAEEAPSPFNVCMLLYVDLKKSMDFRHPIHLRHDEFPRRKMALFVLPRRLAQIPKTPRLRRIIRNCVPATVPRPWSHTVPKFSLLYVCDTCYYCMLHSTKHHAFCDRRIFRVMSGKSASKTLKPTIVFF